MQTNISSYKKNLSLPPEKEKHLYFSKCNEKKIADILSPELLKIIL